jgi:hypothetical protein
MLTLTGLIAPFVVLMVILLVANVSGKVLREYERAVIFTLTGSDCEGTLENSSG